MRYLFCAVALLAAPAARAADDGFVTIFDGKTLEGWDGDPRHWSVVDGVIRGDSSKNRARGNTFVIWRGGTLKDFELKLEYKLHGGNNSGVQYRSKEISKWVMNGYQAEVQNLLGKTGFLYHERGRGWLVDVGDFMEISREGAKVVVGEVARLDAVKRAPYHKDKDWNAYHFIVRGNHVIHYLGGYQTIELIDYHVDRKNPLRARCESGLLALQIHAGSPMTVDFRNIKIKHLREGYGEARRLFNGKDLTGWKTYDRAAWTVKPLEGARTNPRGGTTLDIGGVLTCTGRGRNYLSPDKPLGRTYLVRYQIRAPGDTATGGATPFKKVKGWSTCEVAVDGRNVTYTLDGVKRNSRYAPVVRGTFALPSRMRAEYRNIVVIPVGVTR